MALTPLICEQMKKKGLRRCLDRCNGAYDARLKLRQTIALSESKLTSKRKGKIFIYLMFIYLVFNYLLFCVINIFSIPTILHLCFAYHPPHRTHVCDIYVTIYLTID